MLALLRTTSLVAALAAAVPTLTAQTPPYLPLQRTLDILQVDSSYDGVWRKADLNQDGDVNDVGEITVYYDDQIGSILLTNPSCITIAPGGTVYVGDSTVDIVLALDDLDGNGDCLSPGEHRVFFDSATNGSGIVMASIQGITADAFGNVWCAVSNAGSGGTDMILKLTDTNQDGDADDPGEASVYCNIPNSAGQVGDSIPTKVVVGPDTNLYYTDVGATGAVTKGVWRLIDLDGNGDCNGPGEVNLFWTPPAPGNAFYWGLAVDRDGWFYVTDHGNETIWRGRDLDGSGRIDANEETLFYQTSGSTFWDVIVRDDNTIIVCEDQTPDRLTALTDRNGDGDALDQGEAVEIYDDTVSPVDTRPRGATFLPAPTLAIQPSTVGLGQTATIRIGTGKPGDFVALAVSSDLLPTPIPVPPIGFFELLPNLSTVLLSGTSNTQAFFDVSLPVPNDASLIGARFAFQALAGDSFRNYLSNGGLLQIQ